MTNTDIAEEARELCHECWVSRAAYDAKWSRVVAGLGVSADDYVNNAWENLRAATGLDNAQLMALTRSLPPRQ